MNIVEFHRIDENNPGDFYSNPARYFFKDAKITSVDIDKVKKISWHQSDIIIVGGGGLLGNTNFEPFMERIMTHPDVQILQDVLETKLRDCSPENKKYLQQWKEDVQRLTANLFSKLDTKTGPRFFWGGGHNSREMNYDSYSVDYPNYLNKFNLVGVRDWDTDYRWVPCASCMHEAFDKEYEIKNEFVWFEHKKRLMDSRSLDLKPAPRMLNTGQNFEQIIEFLGSARTVVTNSYHGVYWATLLKRKVVCIPWSTKFMMFKHPPTMANEHNWTERMSEAKTYPSALEECREENIKFYDDVIKIIK